MFGFSTGKNIFSEVFLREKATLDLKSVKKWILSLQYW